MNIMLIDDDQDCIVELANAIEPSGHECGLYTIPEEAVAAYGNKNYDVVITDMKMPGMNGIQVLKAIKEMNSTAKVIINTGYGDVDTAISAVNNGAYAFFGKPVDISELLETLEKINVDVEAQKKSKEEHARLAMEYTRLKMAYEEMMRLLKEKAGER